MIYNCSCSDPICTWEIHGGHDVAECPGCGFMFDCTHTEGETNTYSCPNCNHGEIIRGLRDQTGTEGGLEIFEELR